MVMKKNPPVSFNKKSVFPTVDGESFVDDTASLIGDVRIGRGVYVAPLVSVRADEGGTVIHGPTTVEDNSFVGFRAVIHGAKIGSGSYVGHGAIVVGVSVAKKSYVPHGKILTTQEEADGLSEVPDELAGFNDEVLKVNGELSRGYGS